jgi:hypothetical protein
MSNQIFRWPTHWVPHDLLKSQEHCSPCGSTRLKKARESKGMVLTGESVVDVGELHDRINNGDQAKRGPTTSLAVANKLQVRSDGTRASGV